MRITVNGEPRDVRDDATVARVVSSLTAAPSGVAVALNGDLLTRGEWVTTSLQEADQLEVLTASQGG